jgi:hypothetical protein
MPYYLYLYHNNLKSKGVKKRRRPKDFGPDYVQDDSVDILQPPKELSPELLQLLQDIGAVTEKASVALAQRTDSPPPAEDFFIEPTANRMSFSTIFGGTHTTSDNIPPTILSNGRQFEPSQLLSASLDEGAPEISSFSRGKVDLSLSFFLSLSLSFSLSLSLSLSHSISQYKAITLSLTLDY